MPIIVKGYGPPDAKICLIGEAPGATETKTGEPFSGMSGQLLTKLMQSAGISRCDCYITNVVKEQPPGNEIDHFIKFGTYGKVEMTPRYKEYEAQLYEELKGIKANVYVAVGNVALFALTRLLNVTKRRGSILVGTQIGGKKVIPIIHPASALRQYMFTNFIQHDLKRVMEESGFPEVRLPARNYILRPTFFDTMNFLERCRHAMQVGFDIEVMNEEVSCISFAITPFEVICIPFTEKGHDYFTLEQEGKIWLAIADVLQNKAVNKVGQNLAFDATFLFVKYGIRVENMDDTMIAQAICFPDMPKGLDFICSAYTKEPYYKDEGKKWFKFGGSEMDFWLYNAKDSAVCLEAWQVLQGDLRRLGNEDTYRAQCDLIQPLVYMQARGIKADVAGMRAAAADSEAKLVILQEKLNTLAGGELNSNSSKQLQEYFYIKKGIKPYVSRSTGAVSVDALALKRLSRKGLKEAEIILEMRHLGKLKSTYFEMNIDDDNRIRCSMNPVGTTSGRLSSSKTIFDKGGNMQNLPPDMLAFLKADEGCILYNIDLAQAENRIVAYIAPEPNMISAFETRIDVHSQTAGLIFGKPIGDISDEPGTCSIGGGLYSERFWGKKANHGLNYDLGYKAFALLYEIQESESKFILDRYHAAYPGIRQYHTWIRAKLAKDRILENCFGRRRIFLDRWGDDLFKDAYAFTPQSTVADIINRRGINFLWKRQDLFRPVDLLNQVHDSLVFQISLTHPCEVHAECILRLRDSLEGAIHFRGTSFGIPADLLVGVDLNKKKMKGVKFDEWSTVDRLAGHLHAIHGELRAS